MTHTESLLGGYFDYRQTLCRYKTYLSLIIGDTDHRGLDPMMIWTFYRYNTDIWRVDSFSFAVLYFRKNKKFCINGWCLSVLDLIVFYDTSKIYSNLGFYHVMVSAFPLRLLSDSVFILS